jgi:hypothetical protein
MELAAHHHAPAKASILQGESEPIPAFDRSFSRHFHRLSLRGSPRIRRDGSCHYTLIWRLILRISCRAAQGGSTMDEQRFNMSMRKFLKEVGVTSQQAIEQVVREEGLGGKGVLKVKMVLTGEGTGLRHAVEGEIDLG